MEKQFVELVSGDVGRKMFLSTCSIVWTSRFFVKCFSMASFNQLRFLSDIRSDHMKNRLLINLSERNIDKGVVN